MLLANIISLLVLIPAIGNAKLSRLRNKAVALAVEEYNHNLYPHNDEDDGNEHDYDEDVWVILKAAISTDSDDIIIDDPLARKVEENMTDGINADDSEMEEILMEADPHYDDY